jgi:AraC-like DNA-binding protein/quercetin dioxygenase-like cupin family protein
MQFAASQFFSSRIILLSFCVAMKEVLPLMPGYEGAVWSYTSGGHARRRSHRHEELELNLVTAGTAKYLVGERRYDLARGTLIWLFPEQDHLLLDESRDYAMWIVVIRPALLRRVCRGMAARQLLVGDPGEVLARSLGPGQGSWISSLLADVFAAGADADRSNAGLSYAVLCAWAAFNRAETVALGLDVHPAVEKAARLLRDKSEPENLEVLAEQCGLSRSRLSRVFKQQAGVSLVEYRQRQCLERFLTIYGRGRRLNLLDAALLAGFGSYANFHRVFKRLMRQSPADYRRQQNDLAASLAR